MNLVLEFHRSQKADDPFAFRIGHQEYVRRTSGGGAELAELAWDQSLLADLDAVRRTGCDPATIARLGSRLQQFLAQTDWPRHALEVAAAVERGEPVCITLRLSAAELFALPWELLTFKASGQRVGALPGVLLRYEWPETHTVAEQPSPRLEGGRILLAWSAAAGEVPASEHQRAIARACEKGFHPFDPARDVLAHLSIEQLLTRLNSKTDGAAISVLHILCHGAARGTTSGLAWDGPDGVDVVDGGRLTDALAPHAARLRLVVLCACDSGNPGQLGNHLGSVAQALHRAGIQAVVASRLPLSVVGSVRLTEALYGTLLGQPAALETSIRAARQALLQLAGLDWASLQLYVRADDGDDTRPIVFRPYRGLLAFEPEHHRYFFGREPAMQEMIDDLNALIAAKKPRLLLVTGASGTGKSSLVLAGAVPRLLQDSGAGWQLVRMRPGSEPQKTLEKALSPTLSAHAGPARPLLLVVDQFEEVFTHVTDPVVRQAFSRRLWTLAADPGLAVSVILTLRVDFIGQCGELQLDDSGLALDRVAFDEAHRVFVSRLDREALRAAIETPLHLVGLQPEEGLVSRMLKDVGAEPGALPLLQDTLDLLWQRRKKGMLTQQAYDEIGGVTGALHGRADALLDALSPVEQRVTRRLLVRLVSMGDGTTLGTRRRDEVARLRPTRASEAAAFDRALLRLVDARLLVCDGEGTARTVEVAHETLIRSWGRLCQWVKEEQQAQEMRRRRRWQAGVALALTAAFLFATIAAVAIAKWREARGLLWSSYVEQGRQQLLADNPIEAVLWLARAQEAGSRDPMLPYLLAAALRPVDAMQATLVGHQGEVRSASFSPDGRRIVTAAHDGTARIWDAESGQLQATLKSPQRYVWGASFSPDGHRVITANQDGTLRVFDTDQARLLFELKAQKGRLLSASFRPDGRRIVTTGDDKTVQIFDAESRQLLIELSGHEERVFLARYSPDGRRIVTASTDTTARIWDGESGQLQLVLKGHGQQVLAADLSPDGQRVITGCADGKLRIFDATNGQLLFESRGHNGGVDSVAFSPDGRQIVTASADHKARIWEARSGELLAVLPGHGRQVRQAAYSPDSRRIVTASADRTVRVWTLNSGLFPTVMLDRSGYVYRAAYRPDSRRIVTASEDNAARIWDVESGQQLAILQGHSNAVVSAAYSPDGRRIVTASHDNTARVFDAESGRSLALLSGHEGSVRSVAFSPDGRRIATASYDRTARVFDAESGRLLSVHQGHDGWVLSAVWSPDGQRVLSAGATVRMWDAGTGRLLREWRGYGEDLVIIDAAFSPDARRIVAVTTNSLIQIWTGDGDQLLKEIRGNEYDIFSARFSPDGRRIVTASRSKGAQLWEVETGRLLTILSSGSLALTSATFSPDGRHILTASADGTVRNWEATREENPQRVPALLRCHPVYGLSRDLLVAGQYDPNACVRRPGTQGR